MIINFAKRINDKFKKGEVRMEKKILVTGATGNVGSKMVQWFNTDFRRLNNRQEVEMIEHDCTDFHGYD